MYKYAVVPTTKRLNINNNPIQDFLDRANQYNFDIVSVTQLNDYSVLIIYKE